MSGSFEVQREIEQRQLRRVDSIIARLEAAKAGGGGSKRARKPRKPRNRRRGRSGPPDGV